MFVVYWIGLFGCRLGLFVLLVVVVYLFGFRVVRCVGFGASACWLW